MSESGDNNRKEFTGRVEAKEARMIRARREKRRSVWFGLGMMGTIGWSVAVPTLIGIAIGLWLDSKGSGGISWTLTFLFLGLVIGCLNAYYWVKRQLLEDRDETNDE